MRTRSTSRSNPAVNASALLTLFFNQRQGRALARVILQAGERIDKAPESKTEIKGFVMTLSSNGPGIDITVDGTTVDEHEMESLALVQYIEEGR
jgi:hypothetical protein